MTTYGYLASSKRMCEDETNNIFYSTQKYNVNDEIIFDGIVWRITKILE